MSGELAAGPAALVERLRAEHGRLTAKLSECLADRMADGGVDTADPDDACDRCDEFRPATALLAESADALASASPAPEYASCASLRLDLQASEHNRIAGNRELLVRAEAAEALQQSQELDDQLRAEIKALAIQWEKTIANVCMPDTLLFQAGTRMMTIDMAAFGNAVAEMIFSKGHAQAPASDVEAAATLALSALETGSTHDQRRAAFNALRDAVFPAALKEGGSAKS